MIPIVGASVETLLAVFHEMPLAVVIIPSGTSRSIIGGLGKDIVPPSGEVDSTWRLQLPTSKIAG